MSLDVSSKLIFILKVGVTGLHIAAGLWETSAIGLTIGNRMYLLAVSVVILVLIRLEFACGLKKEKI